MVKDVNGNKIKTGDLLKHLRNNRLFRAYPNKIDKTYIWAAEIGSRNRHSKYLERLSCRNVEIVKK